MRKLNGLLKVGDAGNDVFVVREFLSDAGISTGYFSDTYTKTLADKVAYFQQTHLGPFGSPLVVDGITGQDTWWALQHQTGKAQRSYIVPTIPEGIEGARRWQLQIALREHAKNVRERPNGSNRSQEIDKYLPKWCTQSDKKGPPWCCFFWAWCDWQVRSLYSLGKRTGSCRQSMNAAKKLGMWCEKKGYKPIPGDAFVMLYGKGKGHIGFVLRVSEDGKQINTVEGNCGNRVKVGLRDVDKKIVGYINSFGPTRPRFTRGICEVGKVGKDSTR